MWTTCMFLCWLVGGLYSPVEVPWSLGYYRDLSLVDLDGETRSIQPRQAMIVVMITEDCPIANAYQPEIRRLSELANRPALPAEVSGELPPSVEQYPRSCRFVLVHANPRLSEEKARKHAKEYGMTCSVVLDPDQAIAKRLQATVTPQAFLIDDEGTLLYRGRIDDLHAGYGKKRSVVTSRDLENAMTAWLSAQPIPVRETTTVGCRIRILEK